MKLEDYALIGDLRTTALVGLSGSVDWLCLPRTDSAACFAALLGNDEHGRWLICPSEPVRRVSRRYRAGTLILETDFHTDNGAVRLIDFMPLRNGGAPQLIRIVQGLHGEVAMRMEFTARLDYGSLIPWVEEAPDGILALGGPNALHLSTTIALRDENSSLVAEFRVREGLRERFSLTWYPSYSTQLGSPRRGRMNSHGQLLIGCTGGWLQLRPCLTGTLRTLQAESHAAHAETAASSSWLP